MSPATTMFPFESSARPPVRSAMPVPPSKVEKIISLFMELFFVVSSSVANDTSGIFSTFRN